MSNFDTHLKEQAGGFSIEPREQVWLRVEAELDKKKDRRIVGWWWMAPLALFVGGGIFYMALQRNGLYEAKAKETTESTAKALPQTQLQVPENTTAATTHTTPAIHQGKIKTNIGAKPTHPNPTENTAFTNNTHQTFESAATKKNTVAPSPIITNERSITLSVAGLHAVTDKVNSGDATQQENMQATNAEAKNSTVANTNDVEAIVQSNSAVTNSALPTDNATSIPTAINGKKTNLVADQNFSAQGAISTTAIADIVLKSDGPRIASNKAVAQITLSNKVARKVSWRLTAGAGISNNTTNHFNFGGQTRKVADASLPSGTGGGIFIPAVLSANPNKAGASFNLLLQREQWTGKRWQWQVAAGAQYQQARQTAGARTDSVVATSAGNSYRSEAYYGNGSSNSYTGSNLRAYFSTTMAFAVLKNRPSLLLNTGLYTGGNFYNNYLVGDYNNNRYISSKQLYKKGFAGITLGVDYRFKNGMSLGVTAKRDVTKSFTPVGGEKQYWQSQMISIGIPIGH